MANTYEAGAKLRELMERYPQAQREFIARNIQRGSDVMRDTAVGAYNLKEGVKRKAENAVRGFAKLPALEEPEAPELADPVQEYFVQNPNLLREFTSLPRKDPYDFTQRAPGFGSVRPDTLTPEQTKAKEDADAKAKAAQDAEMARRTMMAFRDPKTGVWNFNNTGAGGEVVQQNGQPTGPDVGAPGRGAVSMDTSDEARIRYENNLYGGTPADRAALEQDRAHTKLYETLAKSPFAREILQASLAERAQQNATSQVYERERARAQAEQDSRAGLLAAQADIEESYNATVRDIEGMNLDANQKADALEKAAQRREIELRRAGIPTDASWNRLG